MAVKDWSTTASDNATADAASGINWQEGMPPSQVNDSNRAMMAALKSWYDTGKASFRAHKNGTNQTGIVSGVITKVTFPTEVFDIGSHYDTSNSRWTPPAGPVELSAYFCLSSGLVDQANYRAYIYKNGSELVFDTRALSGTVAAQTIDVSVVDNANGTDYYEAYFYASTGVSNTVAGTATLSWFQGKAL